MRSRLVRRIAIVAAIRAGLVGTGWYATRAKPVAVLTARVEQGRIEVLNIHKGDQGKAGQVFLVLWNEDLVARGQRSNTNC
ncbi:hypothetical protein [Cupriavidus sp. UME77]|uniref:hypothetical protein n=1 Tax=Cupriavidus sp. UME77 TaxID=1862321 RepID=UPI0016030782|nr:hypothetical protein [Cupriavidus sp. UME77]MBB1631590.1 hypothetical protein [Cupriavidus sp. UME77]